MRAESDSSIFGYQGPGYDQLPEQQLQPLQAQPNMDQQGSRASMGAESHNSEESEALFPHEPPQLR